MARHEAVTENLDPPGPYTMAVCGLSAFSPDERACVGSANLAEPVPVDTCKLGTKLWNHQHRVITCHKKHINEINITSSNLDKQLHKKHRKHDIWKPYGNRVFQLYNKFAWLECMESSAAPERCTLGNIPLAGLAIL